MNAQPLPGGDRSPIPEWTFGDRLRKARRTVGLNQREFATKLGVTSQAVAQWEADNNMPQNLVAVVKRVEVLTGVPAAWLLGVYLPATGTGETVATELIAGQITRSVLPSVPSVRPDGGTGGDLAPVIDLAERRAVRSHGLPAAAGPQPRADEFTRSAVATSQSGASALVKVGA